MYLYQPDTQDQSGFSVVEVLLVVLVVAVLAVTGLMVYQRHNRPSSAKNSAATSQTQTTTQQQSTATQSTQANTYQGWNTYTSAEEKASFRYPTNWTVIESSTPSNTAAVDSISIKSPSGAITISWISAIAPGFGGEHNASYPAHTVIDKTPIADAPGLYVVEAITTLDGTTYYPWIAVQDSQGILTNEVQTDLVLFKGRHNHDPLDPSTNDHVDVLFSTSGLRAHENSQHSPKPKQLPGSQAQKHSRQDVYS